MNPIIKYKTKPPLPQVRNEDLPLLNDLNAALQQENHKFIFYNIMFLFAFLVVFVIWAYNSTIDEITRGQGSIIPTSREQVIQSLDPGILNQMLVKEVTQLFAPML